MRQLLTEVHLFFNLLTSENSTDESTAERKIVAQWLAVSFGIIQYTIAI